MDHELFFEILPSNGEPISRAAATVLMAEKLGRALNEHDVDEMIWALEARVLFDRTKHELRRSPAPFELPQTIDNETHLEGWFERYLLREASDVFFPFKPPSLSLVVENTARRGRTTGIYRRPDLCMASISLYHYSPVARFDLFAFELKMEDGCGARSVMQAKSYTDFVNYSYVVLYLPSGSLYSRHLPYMYEQARGQGIGVVLISDPRRDDGYQIAIAANRHDPHPGKIDNFIEERFSDSSKSALRKWVRL
ncbi:MULTISPECIES: hypothetical protein [Rhodomicrobium]|uniref:hypothetical protein n=1 Tax=Rhodomicrobium TaxID=1068 RepID=UPI000F739B6B|nr:MULTISPECIES: hypothetical protein [Rhodomicrobium]